MKRDVIRTAFSRLLMAIVNFVFYIYIARSLGSEFVGKVSLTILYISITSLVSGLLGGSSLVYMIPHSQQPSKLVALSWIGALFISPLTLTIIFFTHLSAPADLWILLMLSMLNIIFQNYMYILLAYEKIRQQNILSVLQLLSMLIVFISLYLWFGEKNSYEFFLISLGISYFVSTIIALRIVHEKVSISLPSWQDARRLWNYGLKTQLASLFGLLTYRTVYFFTEVNVGLSAVGLLSITFQLGEALWLFPRSVALVQFSKISNMSSLQKAISVSLVLAIITTLITIAGSMVLLVLPDEFYVFLLGKDFSGLKNIFLIMLSSFVLMACAMIFNHYHSGSGKVVRNMITSFLSFIFILISSFFLMKEYPGVEMAALLTALGYGVHFISSLTFFLLDARKFTVSWKTGIQYIFQKKN